MVKIQSVFSSFLTIPNAFRQCTITLLIIHCAIPKVLIEKLPDRSIIYKALCLHYSLWFEKAKPQPG